MPLDKVAVVPSSGIGDGLIMMVSSHRLYCQDYVVTTFSKPLLELKAWFANHHFAERPPLEKIEEIMSSFDLIILQNDNSPFAKTLSALYNEGKIKALSIFYPSYEEHKHPPLTPLDRVFHEKQTMVDNTSKAISCVLGLNHTSKNNGLTVPPSLVHRKYKNRVLLHPSSLNPQKKWPQDKFLRLAHLLEDEGFSPVFCLPPSERETWDHKIKGRFPLPLFPTLSDFASYAFESGYLIGNDSGLGHLCSNLQIPTLILSSDKNIRLWRPGWYKGDILTPPRWIPNLKGSRLRESKWHLFISPYQVLRKFKSLLSKEIT